MKFASFLFLFLMLLGGLWLSFRTPMFNLSPDIFQDIEELPSVDALPEVLSGKEDQALSILKKDEVISAPQPLRALQESTQGFLTKEGIMIWTNLQRMENNLPPLGENKNLEEAAAAKIQDMFDRQYFAHVSPSGLDGGDLVKNTGYEFISVGENLALGNFENDQTLVEAWMASPGHRANILNSDFREIGVAVRKGMFEGRTTWLAVQIFALPVLACPQIDAALFDEIQRNQEQLDEMSSILNAKREELEHAKSKWGSEYSEKGEEYNALVAQYNALVAETKHRIDQYNNQVRTFTNCVRSFTNR